MRRGPAELAAKDTAIYPVMYPPILVHRPPNGGEPLMINQVATILRYLGETLGFMPPGGAAAAARADQIVMNGVDFIAEGRLSFHPTDGKGSYASQKDEADRVSREFAAERLLVWLSHFEKIIGRAESPEGPVLGGSALSYADFMLFNVLDASEAQFNGDWYGNAWDNASIPRAKQYRDWMAARPELAEYFGSDRRKPWAGDSMM